MNRVPFYGAVVLCLDEPNVQAILPRVKRPVITYGTSSQADLVIISDVKLERAFERVPAGVSRRRSGRFPSCLRLRECTTCATRLRRRPWRWL